MFAISIDVQDGATPMIASVASGLTHLRPLHAALGGRLERELQDWFAERDGEPNRLGGKKTHFWSGVRSATQLTEVNDLGATVTIASRAFRQRLYGGQIKPVEKKYLAIPAIAEAHGTSPAEIGEGKLHFVPSRGNPNSPGSLADAGGLVWFWLVRSVKQSPDPRALPQMSKLSAAIEDQAARFASSIGGMPTGA